MIDEFKRKDKEKMKRPKIKDFKEYLEIEKGKQLYVRMCEYRMALENYCDVLEKALELVVKDIVLDLQHSDSCASLDDAYVGVKKHYLDKAKEKLGDE